MLNLITAIPEAPFSNRFGRRAGKTAGSFWELSKFGTKSTCKELSEQHRIYGKEWKNSTWEATLTVSWSKSVSNMASVSACGETAYNLLSVEFICWHKYDLENSKNYEKKKKTGRTLVYFLF